MSVSTIDLIPANQPLITALSDLYPGLSPEQVLTLATKVNRLAGLATKQVPWLSATLKQARADAGLHQVDVAAALDCSPSKVIRIESDAVAVSHVDLLSLISLYRITDEQLADRLIEAAKVRRRLRYQRQPSDD